MMLVQVCALICAMCIIYVHCFPATFSHGVISYDKASFEMRSRGVYRNPTTNEVEFSNEVDINMNVDGGARRMKATRLQKQQQSIRVFDVDGNEKQIKNKETAFYTTDNSVVGLVLEENEDGTTRTRVASRSVKNKRVCATNNEVSTCWSIDDGPKQRDYIPDTMSRKARNRTRRSENSIPLVDEYNTDLIVEIMLLVDKSMIDLFRSRNDDEDSAIEDAALYMTLLMAELNHVYRSVGEMARSEPEIPDYDLQVYATRMIYPPNGTDFEFVVEDCDGNIKIESTLDKTGTRDKLITWVQKNYDRLLNRNFDHVAYISSKTFNDGLLGRVNAIGGTCLDWSPENVEYMISVNSDIRDFDILVTLAHEVMHALGVVHDGTFEAADCPYDQYLMAAMVINPTRQPDTYRKFSKCTVKLFYDYYEFARTVARDCLTGSTTSASWKEQFCIGSGRGEVKDINTQCQIQGENDQLSACSRNVKTFNGKQYVPAEACYALYTVKCGTKSGECGEYELATVTDGTPCYRWNWDTESICHVGKCTSKKEVCASEVGLTTELIPVQSVCRCNAYKGQERKQCCATGRKPDGSCCRGCVADGDECVKPTWSD